MARPKDRPPMERFNLFLTPMAVDQLHALADFTGLSIAEHMRRAVDGYLKYQAAQGNVPLTQEVAPTT